MKQLFRLQLQVNVNFTFSLPVTLFIFCTFFFSYFTFFEFCFLIPWPGPPEINPQLINQSVTYNSPLQFNCSLSGFPTPEVHWTKNGIHLGKKNTLTIRQARFEDSGEYTCSAKNPTGSKKSTFWIEVKGGTVLIHTNEKELWFMILTNVQFRYCKNSKVKTILIFRIRSTGSNHIKKKVD